MRQQHYPILEFDPARHALINATDHLEPIDIPKHCVVCFFSDVIDRLVRDGQARLLTELEAESGRTQVYEVSAGAAKVALFNPGLGGPSAAKNLEKVIALGCDKFIACGGAGVLDREIQLGHIVVPDCAVRDEGTSYHYLEPGQEAKAHPAGLAAIQRVLDDHTVPYVVAKTWTTDAFYRSTPAKIARRRAEGCLTVEMECAAFFAVAEFRDVVFAQLLYGGDDLGSERWDSRDWTKQVTVREKLFWFAVESCLAIEETNRG